eukprot:2534224-Rhodomonas_salina.1
MLSLTVTGGVNYTGLNMTDNNDDTHAAVNEVEVGNNDDDDTQTSTLRRYTQRFRRRAFSNRAVQQENVAIV